MLLSEGSRILQMMWVGGCCLLLQPWWRMFCRNHLQFVQSPMRVVTTVAAAACAVNTARMQSVAHLERRVWVQWCVAVQVVVPVGGHPLNGVTLTCLGAQPCAQVLKPSAHTDNSSSSVQDCQYCALLDNSADDEWLCLIMCMLLYQHRKVLS